MKFYKLCIPTAREKEKEKIIFLWRILDNITSKNRLASIQAGNGIVVLKV